MRLRELIVLVSLTTACGTSLVAQELKLETETDRISYSLGYQLGDDFKRQSVGLDAGAMLRGIGDASAGAAPQLSQEEMAGILSDLKGRISAAQREDARARFERKKKEAGEKRDKGRAFLAENADKPGVKTMPSGLQYKVITAGTGKKPGSQDTVTVNYRGTLINRHEFDSSYRRGQPATFRVDGVIKGWTQALQMMREGARWQLFVPPDLAYGERGPLANETLIFEVELRGVGDDTKAQGSMPESKEQP
jgi:FKBP-type peptidyl-prolyl cis-trans isomerase FklB